MKNIAYSLVLWIVGTWCSVQPVQAQLYKDPSRPAEERAADLLQRMTLEEKIAQIRHIHSWDIFDGQRLDTKRLRSFVGDRCWGFVEGFPLTGESCHDNMNRIYEDVAWFIEKYDYKNKDADWKNSKDAIQRGMQKLRGSDPSLPPHVLKK